MKASSANTLLLVLISVLSTVLIAQFGSETAIGYDGWWHIFIARAGDWQTFWSEIFINPHPPLYHIALKISSSISHSALAYRSISILSAGVSIFIVGKIVARTTSFEPLSIFAALFFGSSITLNFLANEVRSYTLAGAFFLWALWHYLAIVGRSDEAIKHRILFAFALFLGALTHYSILLSLPAFALASLAVVLFEPADRSSNMRTRFRFMGGTFLCLLPASFIATLSLLFHIRRFKAPMNYMPQFYLDESGDVLTFLWESLLQEWDLFAPFSISSAPLWVQVVSLALLVFGVLAALLRAYRLDRPEVFVVPVVFIGMVVGFAAAALLGRYPFGGMLRHQYVPFILALLTAFIFFDWCIAKLKAKWIRQTAIVLVFVFLLGATMSRWSEFRRQYDPLFFDSLVEFGSQLTPHGAVYVDQFSLIPLFSFDHENDWIDHGRIEGMPIQVFRVEGDSGYYLLLRELGRWRAHIDDPEVQETIAQSLEALNLQSVDFLGLIQNTNEERPLTREMKNQYSERLRKSLAYHRLDLDGLSFEPGATFARITQQAEKEKHFRQIERVETGIPTNSIEASPNPIRVCDKSSLGMTRIAWNFPGQLVEIRVRESDGKKFAAGGSRGYADTGRWVANRMKFFAISPGPTDGVTESQILGSVEVRLTQDGCLSNGKRSESQSETGSASSSGQLN